jgi:hypothetical protein
MLASSQKGAPPNLSKASDQKYMIYNRTPESPQHSIQFYDPELGMYVRHLQKIDTA